MDEFIRNIGNQLLDTTNLKQLNEIKYRLETNPFCGLDKCYDLEHFVFYIIKPFQRDAIIEHIRSITLKSNKIPHIFTTFDYTGTLNKTIKLLLEPNKNDSWITILSNTPENHEYIYRFRNKIANSIISGLQTIQYNKINKLRLEDIELDHESESIASDYFKTIINYLRLFPNYLPLWISNVSTSAILLSQKLWLRSERDKNFKWLGSLLDNRDNMLNLEQIQELKKINIHVFNNNQELKDILIKVLNIYYD